MKFGLQNTKNHYGTFNDLAQLFTVAIRKKVKNHENYTKK